MPELPDVETLRRRLDAGALDRPITGTRVHEPALLQGTSPQGLGRLLKGRRFVAARRHGKHLYAALEGAGGLIMHFGMTGALQDLAPGAAEPDYTGVAFTFEDGSGLAYLSRRKLGHLRPVPSLEAFVQEEGLGPDALDLTEADLTAGARGYRGKVKPFLMNQEILAGIGNVYSDEVLFQARLHPGRPAAGLTDEELARLHRAKDHVLKQAIAAEADPERMPGDFLLPHREPSGRCPGCGGEVAPFRASGRKGWYCPRCQPS